MEKMEIKTGEPVTIGETVIVPIIKTALYSVKSGQSFMYTGAKHIEQLLIISGHIPRAFTIDGEEIPVEPLFDTFQELKRLIQA